MKIKLLLLSAFSFFFLFSFSQEKVSFTRGAGEFDYNGYEPLKDKPVRIFYYIPSRGNIKKMRILFSMHGAERSGLTQRGVWRNLAEEHGFIVIAPQFTHANNFPENGYQFGGVSETQKSFKLVDSTQWTYAYIEHIFDLFKNTTGNTAETYDMFGHSAGGQFVHRYLLMTPNARVNKAIAGNPGNYTYPYEDGLFTEDGIEANRSGWPFSLKDTPFATDYRLREFFKKNLIIMVGTKDTEPIDEKTAANDVIRIQGKHRHERAWKYYLACQTLAKRKKMEFNWKIVDVQDAAHSSAHLINGTPNARNWRIENNERVYNIKDVTNYGAFSILFD